MMCVCSQCLALVGHTFVQRQLEGRVKAMTKVYATERDRAHTGAVSYEVFKEYVLSFMSFGRQWAWWRGTLFLFIQWMVECVVKSELW